VLSPVDIALYLRGLPVFERLTARQLMDLAKLVREEKHPPDAVVVREGEYSDGMYVIVEGTVSITKGGKPLSELGPKDFFGEIATLEGSSRSATARSRERLRLLCIRRDDLLRLMEELPAIAIGICESLSRRVRELSDRVVA
jgi:CRP/FNR family cyclic AMP-dependent transcriptional regulator